MGNIAIQCAQAKRKRGASLPHILWFNNKKWFLSAKTPLIWECSLYTKVGWESRTPYSLSLDGDRWFSLAQFPGTHIWKALAHPKLQSMLVEPHISLSWRKLPSPAPQRMAQPVFPPLLWSLLKAASWGWSFTSSTSEVKPLRCILTTLKRSS